VRAARLHGDGDLRVREEPVPVAAAGMTLVRVTAVGICGSDLMNQVYPRAISLAARGVVDLGSLVSSRAGLDSAAEAFGEAAHRTGLKVLIEPLRFCSCVRCGWRRWSTSAACSRS
jgi:threonine dehydrogenase-like Zn-dependent dehydrogenase